MFSGEIKHLDLALCMNQHGAPVVVFSGGKDTDNLTEFFTLHIKEAVEMKATIENLIFDLHREDFDVLREEIAEKKRDVIKK